MVLSDVEITAEIAAKRLVFSPSVPKERIDPSSIDLLLHEELIVLPSAPVQGFVLDPAPGSEPQFMALLAKHGEKTTLADAPFKLDPHRLVIGKTLEHMKLPLHIAGRIEGKSSLARLGLAVHVTAPTVMAGFEGCLYLEIHSVGPFAINLYKDMKIAQLVLEHTGLPPTRQYQGQFLRQT